jgi:hypothetical protein
MTRFWPLALCLTLAAGHSHSARAQGSARGRATDSALRIVVIEGEDAVNVVEQRTAVAPVVEVRDRNDQPVSGALVRFAVSHGRATFNGARTLAATTNAAGRAAAAGLTPTGTGVLQISASATFQGQTVAVTIAQTNVLSAAAASGAAGGGAGAGAAGTGGASAGGAGGGISATTVGVVGGAVAGTVVAAREIAGGSPASGTTYSGAYAGPEAFTVSPAPICTFTYALTGQLTLQITANSNGALSGKATLDEDQSVTQNTCGGQPSTGHGHVETDRVSGSGADVHFDWQRTSTNAVGGVDTWTLSFDGTLSDGQIIGVLLNGHAYQLNGRDSNGSATLSITLK